ncbi:hypothetical protein JB92DRAFT_2927017 [Gautieria morchelliformis]|nr:hypothetical protein JB92DRAFT_2927017 [Gautieria morchelliformis]
MAGVRAENGSPLASKPENESNAGWSSGCVSCDSADSQPALGRERAPSSFLRQSLQTDIPIGPGPNLRDPQCNKGGVLTRGKGRVRLSMMRTLESTGTTWHINRARLCSPITRTIRFTAREPARRSSPWRRCRRDPWVGDLSHT